jgi:hypothetical protein
MALRDYVMVGNSDSGLGHYHRQVREAFPDAFWVGIDRDATQVLNSLCACGQWPGFDAFTDMLERHREVLATCNMVVPFGRLFLTETLRELWQNVTHLRFDARRAAMLAEMKVQPDLTRYAQRYARAVRTNMKVA